VNENECGGSLDFTGMSEQKLLEKVNELLSSSKYKKNSEEIAKKFKDRTIGASQTVVYWTEFLVRNRGAPHLQSAGKNLNFIEFHSFDVYFVLLLAIIMPCFILCKIFGKMCSVRSLKKLKKK
jgi:glucuronosyltransferase